MKTLKKLQLNDAKVLSNSEMKKILGGTGTGTGTEIRCSVNSSCQLYITTLGIQVTGKCQEIVIGGYTRCACVNGEYSSDFSKLSAACTY